MDLTTDSRNFAVFTEIDWRLFKTRDNKAYNYQLGSYKEVYFFADSGSPCGQKRCRILLRPFYFFKTGCLVVRDCDMTTVKVKSVLVPYQQTTEQFLSSGSPKRTQQPPVCSTTETIYSKLKILKRCKSF